MDTTSESPVPPDRHFGQLLAAFAFGALAPINRAWFRLGGLMAAIVNPIVLGFIFFGLLTPVALVGRLCGRDELGLKRRARDSYWIGRPPGPLDLESFKRQF